MHISVSVEIRCPQGSVAFQSQVAVSNESVRHIAKELGPHESWTWRLVPMDRDKIAILTAQSRLGVKFIVNGQETILEGQMTTDFGILFARRGDETIGELPFDGDLTEITVINTTETLNRIDILLGEILEQQVAVIPPSAVNPPLPPDPPPGLEVI